MRVVLMYVCFSQLLPRHHSLTLISIHRVVQLEKTLESRFVSLSLSLSCARARARSLIHTNMHTQELALKASIPCRVDKTQAPTETDTHTPMSPPPAQPSKTTPALATPQRSASFATV